MTATLTAAIREVGEELCLDLSSRRDDAIALGAIRRAGSKSVTAFALKARVDADAIISDTFEMEWPARSGK